jgi:hypothetical protein
MSPRGNSQVMSSTPAEARARREQAKAFIDVAEMVLSDQPPRLTPTWPQPWQCSPRSPPPMPSAACDWVATSRSQDHDNAAALLDTVDLPDHTLPTKRRRVLASKDNVHYSPARQRTVVPCSGRRGRRFKSCHPDHCHPDHCHPDQCHRSLTYFKGAWAHSTPEAFTAVDFTTPHGTAHTYELAERLIDLPVPAHPAARPGRQGAKPPTTMTLRLIVRRSPGGHQTPILTNRSDLTAAISNLAVAKATSATTASHLPLGQVRPGSRLLETETKLLTHAIRMSPYNTEKRPGLAAAPALRPRRPRSPRPAA